MPRHEHLGSLLREAMEMFAPATALVESDRRREVARRTFRDVQRDAEAIAARMSAAGVGPGGRVAIIASNQSAWLLTAVATFWVGAVLVPIDPKLSLADHRDLLGRTCVDLLVIDHGLLLRGDPGVARTWVLGAPGPMAGAEPFESWGEGRFEPVPRRPEDPATIVFSSGTGGPPKGAVLPHRAYLSQLTALLERHPMAVGQVWFSILPTHHAIDFLAGFIGPWVCGATVVHQRALRPDTLRATMARYQPTHMALVPMVLAALRKGVEEALDARSATERRAVDVLLSTYDALSPKRANPALGRRLFPPVHAVFGGRIEVLFCGGSWTPPDDVEFFARFGIPTLIGYGLTEATTVVTLADASPVRSRTVGKPVRGVEVSLHEPDSGGVGEVVVRGPTLMSGYLDDPEATAAMIRDGALHTGDLGRFDASGHLVLVGRIKDLIVTAGGKNVAPSDVEVAFHGISAEECAVVAMNATFGERNLASDALVLVVRPLADRAVDLVDLAERNRGLPVHRRVGGWLEWGRVFPRTTTMKLRRGELMEALRSGATMSDVRAL